MLLMNLREKKLQELFTEKTVKKQIKKGFRIEKSIKKKSDK